MIAYLKRDSTSDQGLPAAISHSTQSRLHSLPGNWLTKCLRSMRTRLTQMSRISRSSLRMSLTLLRRLSHRLSIWRVEKRTSMNCAEIASCTSLYCLLPKPCLASVFSSWS
ncbi:hypothetical protein D3C72_1690900 [compost metagenome]